MVNLSSRELNKQGLKVLTSSPPDTNLDTLLRSMSPLVHNIEYEGIKNIFIHSGAAYNFKNYFQKHV